MRIQNISSNNYSQRNQRKNPAFEHNIYTIVDAKCSDGTLCLGATEILWRMLKKKAVESGKIVAENANRWISRSVEGNKREIVILDTSIPESNKISIKKKNLNAKLFEKIKDDSNTQKFEINFEIEDICPKYLMDF